MIPLFRLLSRLPLSWLHGLSAVLILKRGVCIKVTTKTPKKPNSALHGLLVSV